MNSNGSVSLGYLHESGQARPLLMHQVSMDRNNTCSSETSLGWTSKDVDRQQAVDSLYYEELQPSAAAPMELLYNDINGWQKQCEESPKA